MLRNNTSLNTPSSPTRTRCALQFYDASPTNCIHHHLPTVPYYHYLSNSLTGSYINRHTVVTPSVTCQSNRSNTNGISRSAKTWNEIQCGIMFEYIFKFNVVVWTMCSSSPYYRGFIVITLLMTLIHNTDRYGDIAHVLSFAICVIDATRFNIQQFIRSFLHLIRRGYKISFWLCRTLRGLYSLIFSFGFSHWSNIDMIYSDYKITKHLLLTGSGAVYSFDPVGSYERETCRAAGAASALIQPFLDNQVCNLFSVIE